MPKIKTNRGAAKRFKLTATGKIKRGRSHGGHLLTKKSPRRKRELRKADFISKADAKRIKRMIQNA